MDIFKLTELIKHGEGEDLEFKSSFSNWDGIGKAIASFSSKEGGKIIVGVDDDGNPVGIECNKKLKDRLTQLSREINPYANISVNFIPFEKNKNIVLITVTKGNGQVYSYKNKFYKRQGATNRIVSHEEYFENKIRSGEVSFGELQAKTQDRPAYIQDIDENKIKQYFAIAKSERGKRHNFQGVKQALINLNLMHSDNTIVKNTGILMFGKDPQKFIRNAMIKMVVYSGKDKTSDFIRHSVNGTLYEMLQETILILNKYITKVSNIVGVKRIDIAEYPIEALREGLINAMAHKDYWLDAPEISVDVYKDRIEIMNQARFPLKGLSFEEIKNQQVSIRRNEKTAEMLDDLGLMDKQGRGLVNMKEIMVKHGLKEPDIEVKNNFVKLVFYGVEGDIFKLAKKSNIKIDLSDLNSRQIKFLEEVEKEKITAEEYSRHFSVSLRQAQRDLKELYTKKLISLERKGQIKIYVKIK